MLVSARKREQGTASSGVVYNLRHLHCSRRRYVLCERVGSPWSPRELWATISSLAGVWTAGFVLFNASTAVMNPSLVNLVRCMTIVLGVAVGERYSVATLATLMPLTHPPTHPPPTYRKRPISACARTHRQHTQHTHARTRQAHAHTPHARARACATYEPDELCYLCCDFSATHGSWRASVATCVAQLCFPEGTS
jgi:hypothetical protein